MFANRNFHRTVCSFCHGHDNFVRLLCGQAGGGPPHACGSTRSALGPRRRTLMAKLVVQRGSRTCLRVCRVCVCVCVCVCVVGVRCALLRCVGVGVCCCVHAVYLLCVRTVPLGVCNLSSRRSIRTQHCMPASIS